MFAIFEKHKFSRSCRFIHATCLPPPDTLIRLECVCRQLSNEPGSFENNQDHRDYHDSFAISLYHFPFVCLHNLQVILLTQSDNVSNTGLSKKFFYVSYMTKRHTLVTFHWNVLKPGLIKTHVRDDYDHTHKQRERVFAYYL